MPTRWTCLLGFLLVLSGCGYVGDPKPPALEIPNRVTDLRVLQRADKILVDFTIPLLTTEGMGLRLDRVELVGGPNGEAKPLDAAGLKPGPAHLELPATAWRGREVSFRVRIFSRKGRDSGWSETAKLTVIPPLETPANLKAEAVAEGVRLAWSGPPGAEFRIRRGTEGGPPDAVVATVDGREWLDKETQYKVTYGYTVQAVGKADAATAESDISGPVSVTPVDKFPPGVPVGLLALAASGSVELTWDRNADSDLRGYYLYRASDNGPLERLGGLLDAPGYSDRDVKPGTRYRYSVASVDESGNESGQCGPVEAMLPQ